MKSAIKTAVAELLPVLAARASESEFFSGDRAVEADGENFFSITIDIWPSEINSYIYGMGLSYYFPCNINNPNIIFVWIQPLNSNNLLHCLFMSHLIKCK